MTKSILAVDSRLEFKSDLDWILASQMWTRI